MIGLRDWEYCTIHSDLDTDVFGKHAHGSCIVCSICKIRVKGSLAAHKKAMHYKVGKSERHDD